MTRTRAKPDPVRPSAPDPVDAWLDVLVAMLAIPRADRHRVRDELEDHLRSRIDDLLIHGLTGAQALQKAVAELGETADLARQLSHAHRTPRTRRYAMHTLLIGLTGTVIALGVTSLRPNAGLPAVSVAQNEADRGVNTPKRIPVRDTTVGEVLEAFKSQAERPVMIHWGMLEDIGLGRDDPIGIDADPLRFDTILQLLAERTQAALRDSIAALETPEMIEIGLRSKFDQRTMQRRSYDLSELVGYEVRQPTTGEQASISRGIVTSRSEGTLGLAQLIQTHVAPNDWVDAGGSLARYSAIGNILVITAPERIHAEVEATLKELIETRRATYRNGQSLAQTRYQTLETQHRRLDAEFKQLFDQWSEATRKRHQTADDPESNYQQLEIIERNRSDLSSQMHSIRVRQSTIETQMDELVRTWELRVPDRVAKNAEAPPAELSQGKFAYFIGPSGSPVAIVLPPHEELTLREVLAANGVDPETPGQLVAHYKSGEPRDRAYRVGVSGLFSNPDADRVVLPGDTIALETRFR